MKNPIKNEIRTIFIPVNDIDQAIEWYAENLRVDEWRKVADHLVIVKMGNTDLVFDSMPKWRDKDGKLPTLDVPVIQFLTDDIVQSYQYMKENGVELVTDIEHNHYFVCKDLDGNLLMVCEN